MAIICNGTFGGVSLTGDDAIQFINQFDPYNTKNKETIKIDCDFLAHLKSDDPLYLKIREIKYAQL